MNASFDNKGSANPATNYKFMDMRNAKCCIYAWNLPDSYRILSFIIVRYTFGSERERAGESERREKKTEIEIVLAYKGF